MMAAQPGQPNVCIWRCWAMESIVLIKLDLLKLSTLGAIGELAGVIAGFAQLFLAYTLLPGQIPS